jgi:peptidoglycan/LPS O-acetylase OafA/YrhL
MIQRIQSVFLLLAALCFGALFTAPFAFSTETTTEFLSDKVYGIEDHVMLLALTILGVGLSLVAIFLYKNRPLQSRLGYIIIIIAILIIVATILLFLNEVQSMSASNGIQEGFGILLPILGIVFVVLANKYIKKDEKIVRSADRLR